ncbi:MAG: RING finger protein [Bacteroidia bacterium]
MNEKNTPAEIDCAICLTPMDNDTCTLALDCSHFCHDKCLKRYGPLKKHHSW